MPILVVLIPAVMAYIFFIPYVIKEGLGALRCARPHVMAASSVAFCTVALMLLFMDFAAPLSFSAMKLWALIICSAGLCACVELTRRIGSKMGVLFTLALALLVSVLLETTAFNYKFWQTHHYEPVDISDTMTVSNALVPDEDKEGYLKFESSASIIHWNVDREINNVRFDATAYGKDGKPVYLYVTTLFTDSASAAYINTPKQTIFPDATTSKYLELEPSGEVEHIRFNMSSNGGTHLKINSVMLNCPTPFLLNVWRVAVVALVLFLAILLRPKSRVWSYTLNKSSSWQTVIICAVIVAEIFLLVFISTLNPVFTNVSGSSRHHAQYQELAEAMLDGRLYLDTVPPAYLSEMENPYDLSARSQMAAKTGENYYWDAAFFEGKYYVYFGVVPVLLTFLPYHALTGARLPIFVVVDIFLATFVIGAFLLIGKLIEHYFKDKKIPVAAYVLLSLIFVNASGAVFIAKRPDFYSIPIISGLAFTMLGLYFWLSSIREDGSVSALRGSLGSLCMALVAGCRPQLLLASAFIFVIYWDSVFKKRTLFSKKGFYSTAWIILPYVAVAAFLMWYNFARFGSPFDFGQNYNLTTNDMTRRGFRPERLGLAFFTYIIQPPNITASFPFLRASAIDTNYLGTTITESMFGGIFATIPLLWSLFTVPTMKEKIKKAGLLPAIILGICLSVFIALFDAQGAGILARYVSDYAFLALLPAVLVMLYHFSADREPLCDGSLVTRAFLRVSALGTLAYCFMLVFAIYSVEIYYYSPSVFSKVAEAVQFWG